jgi:alpha-L-fucosidase
MKVRNVALLGSKGKVKWDQDEKGLTVQLPDQKPCDHAIALKID